MFCFSLLYIVDKFIMFKTLGAVFRLNLDLGHNLITTCIQLWLSSLKMSVLALAFRHTSTTC